MLLVQQITAEAKQKQNLILDDGSTLVLVIEYKPLQLGWFITQLIHNDFEIDGLRIMTSPNMLHQFKNRINFGLACSVTDNQEPTFQQDFSSGRAQLFILTQAEVQAYEAVLSG